MEKVSVIIPTYKRPKKLVRAIESVLHQTYNNIEVIVVDDNDEGSQYRKTTESLMNKYKDHKNVIYVKHKKNLNGAAARNTGINKSCAKYIAFLDDDDEFLPKKIEEQIKCLKLKDESYKACYCNYYQYINGDLIQKISKKDEGNLIEDLLLGKNTIAAGSSLLIEKQVLRKLGGFDERFDRHQDWEFLVRYFRDYKLALAPKFLLKLHRGSILNKPNSKKYYDIKNFFLDEFKEDINSLPRSKEILQFHWKETSKVFFLDSKYKMGFRLLKKANHYKKISLYEYFRLFSVILAKKLGLLNYLKRVKNKVVFYIKK